MQSKEKNTKLTTLSAADILEWHIEIINMPQSLLVSFMS
jgi:hypothetical protein